jgi:3-oxoacyl-(acyl-carrier-protein) synthase
MRRVVITGMGTVTSLAHNLQNSWKAFIEGSSGIKTYTNDPMLKITNK